MKAKEENTCSEKRNQILLAAQKRFAIYGFEKTTMQEIADDMEMSKGSLYYYFPDKESLYKSIIEQEKEEFLKTLRNRTLKLSNPEKMLHEYAVTRMKLTEKLINLARTKNMYQKKLHSFLHEAILDLMKQEDAIICEILQTGVESDQFKIKNLEETAALFNQLARGLRVLSLRERHIFQEANEQAAYERKIGLFLDIFCKGLQVE